MHYLSTCSWFVNSALGMAMQHLSEGDNTGLLKHTSLCSETRSLPHMRSLLRPVTPACMSSRPRRLRILPPSFRYQTRHQSEISKKDQTLSRIALVS